MRRVSVWVFVAIIAVVASLIIVVSRDPAGRRPGVGAPAKPEVAREASQASARRDGLGQAGDDEESRAPRRDTSAAPRGPELVYRALDGTAAIAGRVLDARGRPIEGAEIRPKGPWGMLWTTDSAGRFVADELEPKPVTLYARHPRYVLAEYGPCELVADHVLQGVEIALADGGLITGSVCTQDGVAVGGASVLLHLDTDVDPEEGPSRPGARTDRLGRYTSPCLPPGDYVVGVRWVETDRQTVEVRAGETASGVDLTASAGGVVRGCVEDYHGNRIPGADVYSMYRRGRERLTVADDEGAFVLPCLEPNVRASSIGASAFGYYETTIDYKVPAEGVVIKLRPAPVVRGRVVDKVTQEPIEGYRVAYNHNDGSLIFDDQLEHPDGRFALTVRVTGFTSVSISSDSHAPAISDPVRTREGDEPPELLFELVRGVTLRFHVTSADDGSSVGGASVGAFPSAEGFPAPWGPDAGPPRTDERGTTVAEHFPPGHYELEVVHAGFPRRQVAVDVSLEDALTGRAEKTIDVVVSRGVSVRGRVVSRTDRTGIAGAEVRLTGRPYNARYTWAATTDEYGAFVFEGILAGGYQLDVTHSMHAARHDELTVVEGEQDEILVELSDLGSVSGRVTMGDGVPVIAAAVSVGSREGKWLTDTGGYYVIPGVDPGERWLQVESSRGGARTKVDVFEGEDTLADFVLGGAAVYGTLVAPGHARASTRFWIEPAPVAFEATAGSCATARADANNQYRLEGLQPGTYRLYVADSGTSYYVVPIVYTIDVGTTDVLFDIDLTDTTVKGAVFLETGSPAAYAMITITPCPDDAPDRLARVFDVSRDRARRFSADDKGAFSLVGVAPGRHRLGAEKAGFAFQSITFDKQPGADLSGLELTLPREVPLTLDVRPPAGGAIRWADAFLYDEDGRFAGSARAWRDAGTSLHRVENAGPGRHVLFVHADGYALWRGELTLEAGKPATAIVQLEPGHQLAVAATDPHGRPVRNARLFLDPGGPPASAALFIRGTGSATTDAAGRAALDHLADGDYTLHVRCDGYEDASVAVTVAGQDAEVRVALKRRKE